MSPTFPLSGMRTESVLVTPEMATGWLLNAAPNRPINWDRVKQYARDMQAGRWERNHESLGILKSGKLKAGRHRLLALILAGIPVWMRVTFDCPEDMFLTDAGLPRSPTETLNDAHPQAAKVTTHMTAALNGLYIARGVRPNFTRVELQARMDQHGPRIRFVVEAMKPPRKYITISPVMGAIVRGSYYVLPQQIERFVHVLTTGQAAGESDYAAVALRNFLLVAGVKARAKDKYRKTESALSHFTKGQKLVKLYAAANELYTLPEDETDRKIYNTQDHRQIRRKLAQYVIEMAQAQQSTVPQATVPQASVANEDRELVAYLELAQKEAAALAVARS